MPTTSFPMWDTNMGTPDLTSAVRGGDFLHTVAISARHRAHSPSDAVADADADADGCGSGTTSGNMHAGECYPGAQHTTGDIMGLYK